ncbi:unnamed protein product [Hyaloperonospora brassicae]|uniref:RxLR effector candidate protein n=1 Tax=Hyaloperonospora brassicae TaxID=162125 RepID=A0AAV0TSP8_HYABA|nr:unnamed protein product [Hyaloperonospora brassicae]
MNLLIGLKSVQAERDADNLPRAQDTPPVLPAQPFKLSSRMLLRITYDEDEELRAVIDKHDANTFFGEAWGILQGGRVNGFKTHVLNAPRTGRHLPDKQQDVLDTLTSRMAHS